MPRDSELRTEIPVKDIMSTPVITVEETDSVELVAKRMAERDLGSIIVVDGDGSPVGIITERDIVVRVTAKNLLPRDVQARSIMSTPLTTIGPNVDIKKAAEIMRKNRIRRLVVLEKGKMLGVITSKDIVAITPALIEIIMEKAKIRSTPALPLGSESVGVCERCGNWSDVLREVDGHFLCDECRIELHLEQM
ncbi:MAG: CBS domain-containing protein [Candidatus Bathyarchaeia archaeon]